MIEWSNGVNILQISIIESQPQRLLFAESAVMFLRMTRPKPGIFQASYCHDQGLKKSPRKIHTMPRKIKNLVVIGSPRSVTSF